MSQYKLEYILTVLLCVATASMIISSICMSVAWLHWEDTLDRCPYDEWRRRHYNCGCILFSQKFETYFRGGSIWFCYLISFGQIPVIIVLFILGGFHFVRVCINRTGRVEGNVKVERRDGEVIVTASPVVQESDTVSPRGWYIFSIACVCLTVYVGILATLLTRGYYQTCDQYKKELVHSLNTIGNQQDVILGRLSCSAIYDFMDYIFPDNNNYVRGRFINSAAFLIVAINTLWLATLSLGGAAWFNRKIAKFRLQE